MSGFNTETILKLGELDRELIRARRKMEDVSHMAAPQRERVQVARAELARLQDQIKSSTREVQKQEAEAKAKLAEIEKLQVALNTAKTNEEYQSLIRSIDGKQAELSQIETKILEGYEAQESATLQVKQGQERLGRLDKDLGEALARVKVAEDEARARVEELEGRREAQAAQVGPEHLNLYEKILAKAGDAAVAEIIDEICQGCFMKARPEQVSQVLSGKELVTCWTCGRILFRR